MNETEIWHELLRIEDRLRYRRWREVKYAALGALILTTLAVSPHTKVWTLWGITGAISGVYLLTFNVWVTIRRRQLLRQVESTIAAIRKEQKADLETTVDWDRVRALLQRGHAFTGWLI